MPAPRWARAVALGWGLFAAEALVAAASSSLRLSGPPLYPDMSEDLGSITKEEARKTMKVVASEPKPVTFDTITTDVSKFDCDELQAHLKGLMRKYETYKSKSFWKKFEATKINSVQAKGTELDNPAMVHKVLSEADKNSEIAAALYKEQLRIIEVLGLKCGATDGFCSKSGHDLIDGFRDLGETKASAEALMVEAGWLKAEAAEFAATKETRMAAKQRYDEAWRKASDVWDMEQRMATGIMIKAAACGLRPPRGPWGDTKNACDLKPEDPVMQALLKEDPLEFVRRWREEIAKQIGIAPMYVKVDVSACFPLATTEALTTPPPSS